MKRSIRVLIAITILLSGLALAPFVNLPTEAFGWQKYARAYEPAPYVIYLPFLAK